MFDASAVDLNILVSEFLRSSPSAVSSSRELYDSIREFYSVEDLLSIGNFAPTDLVAWGCDNSDYLYDRIFYGARDLLFDRVFDRVCEYNKLG